MGETMTKPAWLEKLVRQHDNEIEKLVGTCVVCGVKLQDSSRLVCCLEHYIIGKNEGQIAARLAKTRPPNRSESYKSRKPITLPKWHSQTGEPMKLYNCVNAGVPGAYVITKFDNEMNVERSYLVSNGECACPRGAAHTCRHRDMLHKFKQYKHINDGWFLDWDTRIWHEIAISQTVAEEMSARNAPEVNEPPAVMPMPPADAAPATPHPVAVTSGAPKLLRRLVR